jgi:predicted cupin superfamily sugar epimerase
VILKNKAMLSAADIIALLDLKPHSLEGGYFRETYRSTDRLPAAALPAHYGQEKSAQTAMYYLLTPETFSALHRLPTDETFHFYLGGPVTMLQLAPDGGRVVTLGTDLAAGQHPQIIVPRGVWQGSFVQPGSAFALLGTTMAPGFDFIDYKAGDRDKLTVQYPDYAELIQRLTHANQASGRV